MTITEVMNDAGDACRVDGRASLSPKMLPVRVVVVDDQALFREGLVALLNNERSVSVVGQAEDGVEAIERARALEPDVVLMDVAMPRLDGIHATARIAAEHPAVRVLILASVQSDDEVVEAMRQGASGYMLKNTSRAELVGAIKRAAEGRHVLSHESQLAVVGAVTGKAAELRPPDGLTQRQVQLLRLMSAGLALKQIARELGLADKTVRNQASLMYAKLRVHDRVQAILYALRKGLA